MSNEFWGNWLKAQTPEREQMLTTLTMFDKKHLKKWRILASVGMVNSYFEDLADFLNNKKDGK